MILRAILALLAAACLAACATATPDEAGAKRIALTFDDVPRNAGVFLSEDERTTRLIDGLERAGVEQAAFFVTTGNLDQTTGGAERIARYVGEVLPGGHFGQVHVAVRVVGQHMARRDITRDPLGPAGGLAEVTGGDEERRLLDARSFEPVDQPRGPLVLGQERARVARHIVESQRDALRPFGVRRGGGAGGEAGGREQGENRAKDHAIVGITKAYASGPRPRR